MKDKIELAFGNELIWEKMDVTRSLQGTVSNRPLF
jgi:hypothetical protein